MSHTIDATFCERMSARRTQNLKATIWKKKISWKCSTKSVHELKILEDVKLKIKPFCIRHAAELAKVMKSERK